MLRHKLVSEYLSKNIKNPGGLYALEIETESLTEWRGGCLIDIDSVDWEFKTGVFKPWYAHRDGSLRNYSLEFVSKKPWSLDVLEANVYAWALESEDRGIKYIDNAPATSVHVHVNFLPETMHTLISFITLWFLLEDHMALWAGDGRKTNLFALPARAAQGIWVYMSSFCVNVDHGHIHGNPSHKYSALNLYPLTYQGSVEIRLLGGTSDPAKITGWVRAIDRVLATAREMTAEEIMSAVVDDPAGFAGSILGDSFVEINRALVLRNYLAIQNYMIDKIALEGLSVEQDAAPPLPQTPPPAAPPQPSPISFSPTQLQVLPDLEVTLDDF